MSSASIYQKVIDRHGARNQCLKAIEELSELSRVLIRNQLYGDASCLTNVYEEMADVFIMFEQLKLMYPKWEKLLVQKLKKLEKLA